MSYYRAIESQDIRVSSGGSDSEVKHSVADLFSIDLDPALQAWRIWSARVR